MEEFNNRELCIKLENLEQQIEKGFAGVYQRQDLTNGKVKKHSEEINKLKHRDIADLKDWKNRVTGAIVVMNVVLLPIVFMALAEFISNL